MAIAGLVTGIGACAMVIWGITVITSGLNSISNELNKGPAAVTQQEAHVIYQGWFVGNF